MAFVVVEDSPINDFVEAFRDSQVWESKEYVLSTIHGDKIADCNNPTFTPAEADCIIWDEYVVMFKHVASGMCYSPEGMTFLKWVSDDNDEDRLLYYRPSKDSFLLIENGHLGKENKKVLIDKTWD